MESQKFFLKAHNEEGCDVISSLLQDSIFHISSHSFHDDKKCLRLMLNRFCWELLSEEDHRNAEKGVPDRPGRQYYRVHSGLYIHDVQSVTVNDNFKDIAQERYLNLLTMHAAGNEINLQFSGHKNVCLKVNSLNIYLNDLHDRYPSPVRSLHEVE